MSNKGLIHVELVAERTHLQGNSSNISINGVLINVQGDAPKSSLQGIEGKVWLELSEENASGEYIIELNCRIMRVAGSTIAVQFTGDDMTAMMQLKKWVA